MITISRSEALDEILLGIYGNKNVNFENHKVIINDDRIRKTLYSPTSATNLRYLLEVTFKKSDVKFEDKKKGKNFALNKETVIDNTVKYFRELGIYIPEVVNSTERTLLGILMCDAILEHILPAIFSNTNTENGKFNIEKADISLEFNKAIDCIKSKFCSGDFFEQLYVDIKSSDLEKLYDSEYSENECNFGVLVRTSSENIFDRLNFVPTISYYADNDNEQPKEPPKKADKQSAELTSKLVSSENLDNKNFVSPYYYIPNKKDGSRKSENETNEYKLSFNIETPNSHFIPRYFYFMTKIDDSIIEDKYSTCKSADQLNKALKEKAINQIRLKYADEIIKYYQQKLDNIELICSKFLSIDVERILSQDIHNIGDFKKALNSLCKENDIDKVWSFCQEKGLTVQQTSRYIYCGIEEAMRDFSFKLSDLMTREVDVKKGIAKKPYTLLAIENYTSKSVIKRHISNLKETLRKANIDELSILRVQNCNFKWNPNAVVKMYYKNDIDPWPRNNNSEDVYSRLKKAISSYCNELNGI